MTIDRSLSGLPPAMAEKEAGKRKTFRLSLDLELIREVKHLAVDEDGNVIDTLEEAMRLLPQKSKKEGK